MPKGTSVKCVICLHPMHEEVDKLLEEGTDYSSIQEAIRSADQNYVVPNFSAISRHYSKHFTPKNIKNLVWKNGQICFRDGTPVTPVSAVQFLEGVINIAATNIMTNPSRIGARDALIAVELMLKIRQGLDKMDEFENAWTEFIKTGKTRTGAKRVKKKKMTVEVTEEESSDPQVIDLDAADTSIVQYEGFDEDDSDDDDGESS